MDNPISKTETRVCTGCGRAFKITAHEVAVLRAQFGEQFKMPIRCISCRKKGTMRRGAISTNHRIQQGV